MLWFFDLYRQGGVYMHFLTILFLFFFIYLTYLAVKGRENTYLVSSYSALLFFIVGLVGLLLDLSNTYGTLSYAIVSELNPMFFSGLAIALVPMIYAMMLIIFLSLYSGILYTIFYYIKKQKKHSVLQNSAAIHKYEATHKRFGKCKLHTSKPQICRPDPSDVYYRQQYKQHQVTHSTFLHFFCF